MVSFANPCPWFDQAPALLWGLDLEGYILQVSDRWLTTLGYDRAAVVGQPAIAFLAPRDRPSFTALLREPSPQPLTLHTAQGQPYRATPQVNPLQDGNGNTLGMAIAWEPWVAPAPTPDQRLFAMMAALEDVFWVTDLATEATVYVNPAFERLFGLSTTVAIGRPWQELDLPIVPEDLTHIEQQWQALVQHQVPFQLEYRVQTPEGQERWVQERSFPVPDHQGHVQEVVSIITDIHDRKTAQATLQQTQKLLQIILDSVPQRIFWKDTQGRFLGCNRQFAQDLGLKDPGELIGKTNGELGLPEPWVEQYRQADQQVLSSGQPWLHREYEKTYRDGRKGWVRDNKIPLRDQEGALIGVIDTYEDITAQKKAERNLQRYVQMVEASTDGICLIDRHYRYHIVNATYAHWYAPPGESILGRTVAEVLGQEAFELRLRPLLERVLAGESITYTHWFDFPRFGRRFRSVTCLPYTEADGTISGFVTSIRDLTALKLAQQQRQELQEVIEATTDFIGLADPQGQVLYLNPAMTRFLGETPGAPPSRNHISQYHPPEVTRRLLEEALPQAIAQGTWQGETALLAPDGAIVPVSQTITAHYGEDGQVREFSTIMRDMSDQRWIERAFRHIVEGTAPAVGADFFSALAQHLATALEVAYVMVSELLPEAPTPTLTTLAIWSADNPHCPHLTYRVQGTPCEQTLKQGQYRCLTEVVQQFPEGLALPAIGVDSYLGVALVNGQGETLGEICILDTKPIQHPNRIQDLLQIFAARATVELERQRITSALEASETLNRAIVTALPDLLIRMDRQGVCLDIQYPPAFPLAHDPSQQVGRSITDFLPSEIAQQRIERVQQAIATGVLQVYEFQIPIGDTLQWEEARIVPLSDKEALVLVRNIHQRKQAEAEILRLNQELAQQNQHLEALVEQRTQELLSFVNALPDQIFVVDRATESIMPFANEAAAAALGRTRATYENQSLEALFGPERAAYHRRQNCWVFETGTTLHVKETMDTPRGKVYLDTYKIPLKGSDGKVYALIGTSRDITDLVKAQQAIQTQASQLEATNQELEAFSYSISHDLRAPLRHINGFIDALGERLTSLHWEDPQVNHYLAVVKNSSNKMEALIEGLLTLAQVRQQDLVLRPLKLNTVVHGALTILHRSPGQTATYHLQVDPLPTVPGDSVLLQQVFVNLLENAFKFSQAAQPPCIHVGYDPDLGAVFVRDNGIGFEMSQTDRLFTPFQRLHRDPAYPGTGIGLATVQRIIHRHRGRIWATSAPGQGTTVYFTLGSEA